MIKSLLNTESTGGVKQLPVADQALETFEPISALPRQHQTQLYQSAAVLECTNGYRLFEQGDEDKVDYYLLQGSIDLYDDKRQVKQIKAENRALSLIDPRQPRPYAAVATAHALVLTLPRGLLQTLTNLTGPGAARPEVEVDDIDSAESNNWMIRMLQSKAFSNVPSGNLHKLFLKMDSIPMRAGDSVVQQGEPGDHFYVVQSGTCLVKRRPRENAPEIKLAELGPGDSFGEEALIAGKARNASVEMSTDGRVMRLGKDDFMELVKDALVREVDGRQADTMMEHGAKWIDIRAPADFERASVPGSVNIELAFLREQCANLDAKQTYMVCSDSPTRSACGAFLLAAQGIDVCSLDMTINEYLLERGLLVEPDEADPEAPDKRSDEQRQPASSAADLSQEPLEPQLEMQDQPADSQTSDSDSDSRQIDPELLAKITRDIEKRLRAEMETALQAERRRWELEMQARFNDYKTALKAKVEKQQQELKAAYRRKLEEKLRQAKAEPAKLSATADSSV